MRVLSNYFTCAVLEVELQFCPVTHWAPATFLFLIKPIIPYDSTVHTWRYKERRFTVYVYTMGLKTICCQGVEWIQLALHSTPLGAPWEHGNEYSVSIKEGKFLDQPDNYQHLKEPAAWSLQAHMKSCRQVGGPSNNITGRIWTTNSRR